MARAAVLHLGCKVNRVEADGFERLLEAAGLRLGALEDADVIVINTCTVTGAADKKARKALRAALRANPRARVFVTGCAVAVNPEQFEGISQRVSVLSGAELSEQLKGWASAASKGAPVETPPILRPSQSRPSVKVQDGCDNHCFYCIVPTARGPARSRSVAEVCEEVARWCAAGAGEVVLAGINLGAYNDEGRDLAALLRALLEIMPATSRLRLSSVEPDCVSEELIELMSESDGKICRHLHLPLQSGSSKVLKAMNRHYDSAAFVDLCDRLREAMPTIALGTDLIVGFPGESERDFEETLAVAKRCAFSRIHQFSFSPRPGTPAAEAADALDPTEIHRRAVRLRALGDELARADFESRQGTIERALIEAPGRYRLESYHLLEAPVSEAAIGSLVALYLGSGLRVL